MIYVLSVYWPFLIAALLLGVVVGWWFQDPRSADDATAWLDDGADQQ